MSLFIVMTTAERAHYETWRELRPPYRDGSAQQRAYVDGHRAGRAFQAHVETCPDGCPECADQRAWGECTGCGDQTEAVGPDELSLCCGSKTNLRGDA